MDLLGFRSLCRDTAITLALDDPDTLFADGYLELDDLPISLRFEPDLAPDRLFCYADLGPVEDQHRLVAYENLLTLNLLSGTKTSGVYTLDPASGHVVFAQHLMQPDRLNGEQLAALLRTVAAQARSLRTTLLTGLPTLPVKDILEKIFDPVNGESTSMFA